VEKELARREQVKQRRLAEGVDADDEAGAMPALASPARVQRPTPAVQARPRCKDDYKDEGNVLDTPWIPLVASLQLGVGQSSRRTSSQME
jgi:hypothetical protein